MTPELTISLVVIGFSTGAILYNLRAILKELRLMNTIIHCRLPDGTRK